MTTVRELEQELNVSRVSLYALLKKEPFKEHVVKGDKNVIMATDKGAELLRNYYSNKIRGGTPRKNVTGENGNGGGGAVPVPAGKATENGGVNGCMNNADGYCTANGGTGNADPLSVIGVLQQQLAKKDEQIDNLLAIISNLQKEHA
jgi:hypothetical protein